MNKVNVLVYAGAILLLFMTLAFTLGPLLSNYQPDQIDPSGTRLSAPSADHIMGTDQLGRDVFARVLQGGRISMFIALGAGFCCLLLGSTYGALSGYIGGRTDAVCMRIVDVLLSFPVLYLAVTIMAVAGMGLAPLAMVIVLTCWMDIARLVRADILSIKTRPYITKALASGYGLNRVLFVHILPNVLPTLLAIALLRIAEIIMLESALSYLGLGVQPPAASLGSIISDGRMYLATAWWITVFPGAAIVLTTVGLYLLGEGLHKRKRGELFLTIEHLKVYFKNNKRVIKAVDHISFTIQPRQTFALVGESGSGKSVTAASILKLVPPSGRMQGNVIWKNQNIAAFTEKQMQRIRGGQIGLVLQDPLSALNPVICIGKQIAEVIRFHNHLSKKESKRKALELMQRVYLSPPDQYFSMYAHELSGGLRQRALIAIALAANPELLIADEPTTALDVSVQQQILLLLSELKKEMQLSILLITHDLGVVSQIAEHVAVMYAGKIVEIAAKEALFANPQHPYTQMLFKAIPGFYHLSDANQTNTYSEKKHKITGTGCSFVQRCPESMPICSQAPQLKPVNKNHSCACHQRNSHE
ncbi:MAG: dipeptide/oligopeptide/nickel ABC transporter permease/ATP-binding protein [candidate division KSB1 bacterium]|nr:dipeptide/oligopeptide/nickel ABC transporter permease/ATP-binding protein [candidate division KSB1 bacterium]